MNYDRINFIKFSNTLMRQDQPFNQQTLFAQVSTLLKGFRTLLKTLQQITQKMASQQDYTPDLKKLLTTITELQQPAAAINYVLPTTNHIESIFLRFVSRLNEQIIKLSTPFGSYNGSNFVQTFVNRIQECLKTVNTSRNIGALFYNIFCLFKQFAVVAERIYYVQPITQDLLAMEKKLDHLAAQFLSNHENTSPQSQFPKETQYQKVMNALNGYYYSLNCLDLDFSAFKSFYFQTRTQSQQKLAEQMIQRNVTIARALTHNYKRFQEVQKRKQKNELKKTKIVSSQSIQLSPPSYLKEKRSFMSLFKKRSNASNQQQPIKLESFKVEIKDPQKSEDAQLIKSTDIKLQNKNKGSQFVKNVYLTFRKTIKAENDSYISNLKPINLSQNIEQNRIKGQMKSKEKLIKLSPVKLNNLAQPTMIDFLERQIQSHKLNIGGIGRPVGIIHYLNKQKHKEMQKSLRESMVARKLSRQYRIRDRIIKTLDRPNLSILKTDITI